METVFYRHAFLFIRFVLEIFVCVEEVSLRFLDSIILLIIYYTNRISTGRPCRLKCVLLPVIREKCSVYKPRLGHVQVVVH